MHLVLKRVGFDIGVDRFQSRHSLHFFTDDELPMRTFFKLTSLLFSDIIDPVLKMLHINHISHTDINIHT